MAAVRVFNADNNSSWVSISGERLYLNAENANVNFVVYITDEISETIPAHKRILSAGSPKFEAMFRDSLPEPINIHIVDVTPTAFKEFLQFFYMGKLSLTSGNIISVCKLCHKFKVAASLNICESALQHLLTNNNMCSGYEVATLLNLQEAIYFCEQNFKHVLEITRSNDFLRCRKRTLGRIIQSIAEVSALDSVNAAMRWAKVSIKRKRQIPNPVALRAELNGLIDRIPFDRLSHKEFIRFDRKCPGFLTRAELRAAMSRMMTTIKELEDLMPSPRHRRRRN